MIGKRWVVLLTVTSLLLGLNGWPSESTPSSELMADPGAADTVPTQFHSTTPVSKHALSDSAADRSVPDWVSQRTDEPFDVRQFLKSRTPPPENAAPFYLAALAEISTAMESVYTPQEWQARLPDVQDLETRIRDFSNGGGPDSGSVSLEEIERLVADSQSAVRKLDEAQEKSACVFVTELSPAPDIPQAFAAPQVGRLARIHLYHASQSGKFTDSEQAIRRALRFSRDLRPCGGCTVQLASVVTDAMVMSSIRDITLRCPDLTVEQCDRLLNLIAEHQLAETGAFGEAVRMEYIQMRMMFNWLQRVEPAEFKDQTGVRKDEVNWEAELMTLSRISAAYLEMSEQLYHEVLRVRKVDNPTEAMINASDVKLLPLVSPPHDRLRDFLANGQVRLAGTQMLIAIRRYELAKGDLPESLDIAAEEAGLDGLPADPYSGQPFGYEVIDDRPIVYSVGSDQKDDGGLVDWNDGHQPGDFILSIGD